MRNPLAPALLALLLTGGSALGSGGVSCEAEDKTIRFSAQAGINNLGADFFSFKASLDILAPGTPKDFRKLDLSKSLTQRWFDNRNLKLRMYHERSAEPHGSVDLVIEAWPRKDDELEYRGGYVLTIFDLPRGTSEGKTTVLKGRVTCSVG